MTVDRHACAARRALGLCGALLLAGALLSACGDGADEATEQAEVLRSAATAIAAPAGSGWAVAPDQVEGCTTAAGTEVELPPSQQLLATGTADPGPYLDQVEGELPADARNVQRGDDRLAWTTLGPDGDIIAVQLAVTERTASVTATGPASWCE